MRSIDPVLDLCAYLLGFAGLLVAWELVGRGAARRLLAEPREVWAIYRVRCQQRALIAAEEKRVVGLKASIITVGDIRHVLPDGMIVFGGGWTFDNTVGAPLHRVDENGVYRLLGYTNKEILEIHARRDEFADRPGR